MSVKKFKFVSPGIFINEIDKSQIPSLGGDVGPVVVGRAQRGPFMRPVRVESFSEFVEVFGTPVPGAASNGDAWRDGSDTLAPTYAAYAAQAWLKNSSPLTFVRLAGHQDPAASAAGKAGWQTPGGVNSNKKVGSNAGAYGLFLRSAVPDRPAHAVVTFPDELKEFFQLALTASNPGGETTTTKVFTTSLDTGTAQRADGSYNIYWQGAENSMATNLKASLDVNFAAKNSTGGIAAHIPAASANVVNLHQEYVGSAGNTNINYRLAPSATITIVDYTDTLADGRTLVLQDATGTEHVFTIGTNNVSNGVWKNQTSNIVTATNLVNAINGKTAAAGKFWATNADKDGSASAIVEVFHQTFGTTGNNKTVVRTDGIADAGLTIENFAGGTDWAPIPASPGLDITGLQIDGNFVGGRGPANGCLAAVWYLKQGSEIRLSGTAHNGIKSTIQAGTNSVTHGSSMLTASVGALYQRSSNSTYNVLIDGEKYEFDFSRTSSKFIRKVFNTNPTKTNSTINSTTKNYWLGESFEGTVNRMITGSTDSEIVGFVAALNSGGSQLAPHADRRFGQQASRTGWFVSQDPRTNHTGFDAASTDYVTKLFRLESLDDGAWVQNNIKISIQDIKAPRNQFEKYGSFSVVLRDIRDTDNAPIIMESYTNCNLNPDSENYVARRIGDKFLRWNNVQRKYQEEGNYDNVSKFVRVIMSEDIDANGPDPLELVPFGTWGPLRYKGFTFVSGSTNENRSASRVFASSPVLWSTGYAATVNAGDALILDTNPARVPNSHNSRLPASVGIAAGKWADKQALAATKTNFTGSWVFPEIPLRVNATAGSTSAPTDAYFGADLTQLQETGGGNIFNEDVRDMLRGLPHGAVGGSSTPWDEGTYTEPMWHFTLDDLSGSAGQGATSQKQKTAVYVSGSRGRGVSYTAKGGTVLVKDDYTLSNGYEAVLDLGYDKFTTVLYGGHDGLDIAEREPFRNARLAEQNRAEADNYAFYSVKKAIDTAADAEYVEMDVLSVPGVWDSGITDHVINVCENRSDALAIIDLENDYVTKHESTDSVQTRIKTVDSAVSTLKNRAINSSYACAFYPWVQIRDTASDSGAGQLVWVPPSVAALGTFGSTQRNAELWFAPAGFNRGGLSEGSSGLRVVNVRQKLTAKERDKLYEANINPIASFPSEGIVIFGQKTLQVTKSALDRINVRRLLIYLKKQISRLSTQVLFDPNVQTTWNRFIALVEPFLGSVQARFGIQEYKLVLDDTTTTPDLIDQNVMYAKIFIKPTRTIEFIALDFVVASTGASFEDL